MNKKCDIIEDLLPSYAYNLTTDETNKFVEEHLEECECCKIKLENIINQEKISEETKTKKYIDFAKKYKNKLYLLRNTILFIIIIVCAITVIPIVKRICIISNLSYKAEKYVASSNIHIIKYSYDANSYVKNELWQMQGHKKMEVTNFDNGNVSNVQIYANENGEKYSLNCYSNFNGKKTANLNLENEFVGLYVDNIFKKENSFDFLKASMFATVKKTTFDGKECYYVLNYDRGNSVLSNGVYVDKETGLVINEITYKYENEKTYPATSYIYEFDTVNVNDFIEPDSIEYEVLENNN